MVSGLCGRKRDESDILFLINNEILGECLQVAVGAQYNI
jgi:hypothetical protein